MHCRYLKIQINHAGLKKGILKRIIIFNIRLSYRPVDEDEIPLGRPFFSATRNFIKGTIWIHRLEKGYVSAVANLYFEAISY